MDSELTTVELVVVHGGIGLDIGISTSDSVDEALGAGSEGFY